MNNFIEEKLKQEQSFAIEKSKRIAKRQIYVTFQKEGIHHYPAALTDPDLKEVNFLGLPHRHIFHFKILIDVHHSDRELEFILVKRWLESLFEEKTIDINSKSVEMLADYLYDQIASKYPGRNVIIDISEDNENGCVINYPA